MQLIDTHVHLYMSHFDDDREAVIARAEEAGVSLMVTIGVTTETSRAAVALADKYPSIFAAVGVHPHAARHWNAQAGETLRELASHPKVVAIGEIGLDYYRDRSPRQDQRHVFRTQLALASELGKPVIIHDRDAHGDVLRILTEWAKEHRPGERAGVLHCFSGDQKLANTVIALGFYLGFDGPVTYQNAHQLRYMVSQLPADRLLVETDAPFLTPHPYRGQRNEPANVSLVAATIANARQVDSVEFARQTTENARLLFGLPFPRVSEENDPV